MASSNVTTPASLRSDDEGAFFSFGDTLRTILAPLASLKLTVVLFALAIVIVLAGTLAQVEQDIWPVINEYFRIKWPIEGIDSFFVHIPFQIFFPPSFWDFDPPKVSDGFWFPKGWLIGMGMAINLLSAHLIRFKLQARGTRLWGGLTVIVLGVVVTTLVILSGSNKDGVQDETWLGYDKLWRLFQLCVAGTWLACVYGAVTVSRERKGQWWLMVLLSVALGLITGWLVYTGDNMPLSPSSMRILWQLMKGTFAGLILLGGCALLFRKRAGVVLLHGGIGLMMASEVLVGLRAVEEQMVIEEGQTVNSVQDIRHLELAIVDRSDPDFDHVVSVPLERLQAAAADGKPLSDRALPFDVELKDFIKNSKHRRLEKGEKTLATEGIGTKWTVDSIRPVSGADSGGAVDSSAAYVTLTSKDGEDLGTWLLGRFLSDRELPQTVSVGDKNYDLFLRFKTDVKPYKFYLEDVRKEDYIGTSTPKDYSSVVHLIDEDGKSERRVRIWMNNPLRYAGETFYQSNYAAVPDIEWDPETLEARPAVDPSTGERRMRTIEITTLSVVRNTGWMIPYVACMIVAVGMLAHFAVVLLRFLNRLTPQAETGNWSSNLAWMIPLAIVALFAGWYGSKFIPPRTPSSEMDLYAFGKIPVVHQGRAKPLDTIARNTLRSISGYQTYIDAETDRKEPAIRWLLDVIARPSVAEKHRIFRIDSDEVLNALSLERRKSHLYSVSDLRKNIQVLQEQSDQAAQTSADVRSPYQRKVLDLAERVHSYLRLAEAFQVPDPLPPVPTEAEFKAAPFVAQQQLKQSVEFTRRFREHLRDRGAPLAIPLKGESDGETLWEPYASAFVMAYIEVQAVGGEAPVPTARLTSIFSAYRDQKAREFNDRVDDYREWIADAQPDALEPGIIDFEAYFNHLAPFYYTAWFLYLPAFVFTVLSWLGLRAMWNRTSFWLIVVAFVIHTLALLARMWISGRPPVTNLYSSAVFIGWGIVLLGIILEIVSSSRLGMGNVVAAKSGFATLLIADYLASSGDTFTVLQAVLDTQFWLATHVTSITLGYATTYAAGLLGILYILHGFVAPWARLGLRKLIEPRRGNFSERSYATLHAALDPMPSQDASRDLVRMIHGTICFSIFFSFVGTVLGGLWADDSWGRFWGWDPKENGALIIVIWNALVLHARWDGMVKDRGLAVLAIGGNIVTSWSWFGVNELGVGLHSYGFTEGVITTLKWFVLSQLIVIAIGALPRRMWLGLRRQPPDAMMEAQVV